MSERKIRQNKGKKGVEITRKEAFKRAGKYAAVTAAAMFIVINPLKSQSSSPDNPGGGFH